MGTCPVDSALYWQPAQQRAATLETRHLYTVYGEIASGGMAAVRLGRQEGPHGLSRIVAIKKVHTRCAEDEELIAMFRDEVRVAARVIHPNVVPMLDVLAYGGELLLVMEYVHGESLARLAKLAQVAMPPTIASTIMVGALHGLHAAHEARSEGGEPLHIIHRDVTPHNVVVGVDGLPRLLDFGIAHAVGRLQTTRYGQIKGKLGYMSPEQLMGEALDRRVDIYSAAVTLWELLAGRKLFDGNRQDKVAQMILSRPVERPGLFQRGIPPELDAIVLRGLQREPERRYPTAREMAIALEQQTETVSATELGDWVKRVWGDAMAAREQQILEIESCEATSYHFRQSGEPWVDPRAAAPEGAGEGGRSGAPPVDGASHPGVGVVGGDGTTDGRWEGEGGGQSRDGDDLRSNTATCATVPALPGHWHNGSTRPAPADQPPPHDRTDPNVANAVPSDHGAPTDAKRQGHDEMPRPRRMAPRPLVKSAALTLSAAAVLSLAVVMLTGSGGRLLALLGHGSGPEEVPARSLPARQPLVTMLPPPNLVSPTTPQLSPEPDPPPDVSFARRSSSDGDVMERGNHKRGTGLAVKRRLPARAVAFAAPARWARSQRAAAQAAPSRRAMITPSSSRSAAPPSPPAPVATPPPAPGPDCQPPFFTDAAGIKHFKVSCL